MSAERNFEIFDKDVKESGGYLYTKSVYSAQIATQRQVDEIVLLIQNYFTDKKLQILDIGCGDGTYTLEIASRLKIKRLLGMDPAKNAIKIANQKTPKSLKKCVNFMVGNIYQSDRLFKPNQFDVVILQGILHHLDLPQKAIAKISQISPVVIVLEPNGYNPILKLIEKFSTYHIAHKEKSYWPPTLNKWFEDAGYRVVNQSFIGLVPYFCPTWLAKFLKRVEPFLEKIPFFYKIYCGQNLVVYKKTSRV